MTLLRPVLAPLRRFPRLPRLFARPLVLALLWGRRHTILLWWRTLRHELRREGKVDRRRLVTLATALARVTGDGRLSNAPELRRLTLDGDVLRADVDDNWARRGVLRATLGAVEGVNVVRLGAHEGTTATAAPVMVEVAS